MKTRILASILCAALTSWVGAAEPAGPAGSEEIQSAPATEQGQIEILLAPIALYPDALVALILPAATHPSEIVLASRFLNAGGLEEAIDEQIWDDSVKALARFPEVITFMDENLAWTQDVGDAFVDHPAEVMGAIQALRARATRNGLLASTPQQQVVFDDDETIRIIPAEPEIIYVPYYEPSYLYYTHSYTYYPSSLLWFGVGYGIGSWLSYDCDWGRRTVWVHHYHRDRWNRDYDWRKRYTPGWSSHVGGTDWKRWDPSPSYRRSRPRDDHNYSRPVRSITTVRTDSDRQRFESRRDFSTDSTRDSRSVRRPETLRNPPTLDRNDSSRTVADRDRHGDRGDRRPSDSLTRFSGSSPVETATPASVETVTPQVQRRNAAPTRRAPDIVDRRPESIDRRPGATSRRPEIASPAPQRRETPRPAASAQPPSRPTRTITSAGQLRHPGPTPQSRPAPAVARSAPQVRSSPPPAAMSRSAPAPAPMRQAPAASSNRSESRVSSSPSRSEGRNSRVQTEEN